jgi:carboxypeptidase PM20D1
MKGIASSRKGKWMVAALLGAPLAALAGVAAVRTAVMEHPPVIAKLPVPGLPIDVQLAAERLAELIRLRTVAGAHPGVRQGDGGPAPLEALRDLLVARYPAFHSVATRTVLAGGTLVYEWPGSSAAAAPIVLMAHQDVVPEVNAEAWTHPPFSGAIADGRIWGRGAIDDKGSLVAILEAAEALASQGRMPPRTVYFVFGHDEELAGTGAAAAAAWLEERGVRALLVLDEGLLALEDHPVTQGPVALIGIAEKGFVNVRVVARSPGGHASMPPEETAVVQLARAIQAIHEHPFPLRYDGAVRAMVEALAPEVPLLARAAIANAWLLRPMLVSRIGATPQGAALLRTTIAPTMLAGSPRENVLATEASAWINLRIAPGDTVEGVMRHLQESVQGLGVTLEIVGEARDPSGISPVDDVAYRMVAGAARAVFDIPVAPSLLAGATDSRHMGRISDSIYRFQPILMKLAETAMIHGVDEHLSVDQLGRMIRFYGALLMAEAGGATASSASTSAPTIR